MILSYEYVTRVVFSHTLSQHNILLRCLPAREVFQQPVEECFELSEKFWKGERRDGFGNRIISGGTDQWHSTLEYVSRGKVVTETYCIPDAKPHPMYLLPSFRFGQDNGYGEFLPVIAESRHMKGLDGILHIMHFVFGYMDYCSGTTNINTSLETVIESRRGVCQDYAHLMVALCRQAGYPARYVCGLMSGEGATHAWVEVHDGQCWYAFDPTNDTAVASGYVKLAHGRNALDCPVSRGMYRAAASGQTGGIMETSYVNVVVRKEG